MTGPRLLAIGGAHVDRRGRSLAPFVAGTSNPGILGEEAGGAAFNALRAAARLGIAGAMLSPRGGDAAGAGVAAAISAAGIEDLGAVHLDRQTPTYTALIDQDGGLIGAIADMALYETAYGRIASRSATRRAIAEADAVLIDTNIPQGALERIVGLAADAAKPVFANAISPAKAPRLLPVAARLACLFLNTGEAARLTGLSPASSGHRLVEGLRAKGVRGAIVTRGPEPLAGFSSDATFSLRPPRVAVVDVTGAGDALAGAAIAALMRGLSIGEAARHGVAAAALVIGAREAAPGFSRASFRRMLASVPAVSPLVEKGDDGQ